MCDYVINCEAPNTRFEPLPDKDGDEWGPGQKAKDLKIEPLTHPDGIVEAINGVFEMRFVVMKNIEITANMHSNEKTETEMRPYLIHQRVDDEVIITGKVPEAGDNALEVTAEENGKSSHVCSYFVASDHAAFDSSPYPETVKRVIGPTRSNEKLKIIPKSHPHALIEASGSGDLEITMTTPVPCVLKASLEFSENNRQEKLEGYTFVTQTDKEAIFKIRIPHSGIYVLQMFGRKSDENCDFSNIYNYIIEAPLPKEKCLPFPDPCPDWTSRNKLLQQTNGIVPSNYKLPIAVKIPNVDKVAMIGAPGRTSLSRRDDDTWRGDVRTGNAGDVFTLAAVFPGEDNSYRHLLKYQVSRST